MSRVSTVYAFLNFLLSRAGCVRPTGDWQASCKTANTWRVAVAFPSHSYDNGKHGTVTGYDRPCARLDFHHTDEAGIVLRRWDRHASGVIFVLSLWYSRRRKIISPHKSEANINVIPYCCSRCYYNRFASEPHFVIVFVIKVNDVAIILSWRVRWC